MPEFEKLRLDRRKARTDQIVAWIMHTVAPYLSTERDDRRRVASELFDKLYEAGAEVITDHRRAELGLPPRGPDGWTDQEIQIMEAKMIEAMLRPVPPMILPRGDEQQGDKG